VTPRPDSLIPQGVMPPKWARSGSTFRLMPVIADPLLQADADGGDLVFAELAAGFCPVDPDADAVLAAFALHVEGAEGLDDPVFEGADELLHISAASGEVQHHVGHALAGAVIGELTAALGVENRETGGARAGRRPGRWPRSVQGGCSRSQMSSSASPAAMAAARDSMAATASG